jgi:hypothetical protein
MRKTFAAIVATLVLFVLAVPASGRQLAAVSRPCPVLPSSQPTFQVPDGQPDVIAVFISALRERTRLTVGLMDNQKLKGEFLGVDDGRMLFRADRDRSVTLRLSLSAIHSIKVRNGGAIARP